MRSERGFTLVELSIVTDESASCATVVNFVIGATKPSSACGLSATVLTRTRSRIGSPGSVLRYTR